MVKRKHLADVADANYSERQGEQMRCSLCGIISGRTRGDFFMLDMEEEIKCSCGGEFELGKFVQKWEPRNKETMTTEAQYIVSALKLTESDIAILGKCARGEDELWEYEDLQRKLFNYYAFGGHGMPYGTAKARTGDPDEWILGKLQQIRLIGGKKTKKVEI